MRALTILLAAFTALISSAEGPNTIESVTRKRPISFENEILPIFQKSCLACHSATERQGGLVLESPVSIRRGGDSGSVLAAEKGGEGLLLQLAAHRDEPIMPPAGNDVAATNLTPAELGLMKLWIDQGAKGAAAIDSHSPKQWKPIPKGVRPVQAVALSADGQLLALARANQIFLHHAASGQWVTTLADPALNANHDLGIAHRDLVQSLAMNEAGDVLASGGFREVKLWRRPQDVVTEQFDLPSDPTAMAVSADGKRIVFATDDHLIRLYRFSDARHVATFKGHADMVTALKFTPDQQTVVSGSMDQTIRFWDLKEKTERSVVKTPAAVTAIELVNREKATSQPAIPAQSLVAGDDQRTIRVWEIPDGLEKPSTEITVHAKAISALQSLDRDINLVYSGSLDGTVRLIDISSGRSIRQFSHGAAVNDIAVAPDGQRIASAGENGRIRLHRSNAQRVAELQGDVRLVAAQKRATQVRNRANSRLSIAKRQLDAAEKDIPKKTSAEKTLAESLAESNKEVNEKQQAADEARAKKIDAEKAAIEASAVAKNAFVERQRAENAMLDAEQAVRVAKSRVEQLQKSAERSPDEESLKQLLADARQTLVAAEADLKKAGSAIKDPTKRMEEMAAAANAAAGLVEDVQEPFNKALSELKIAQANQNLLSQQHALASKEQKDAQDALPKIKQALDRAEQEKINADEASQAATEAFQKSIMPVRRVAFSDDGSVLVSAGDFHSIHTWDAKTGEPIAAYAGHQAEVGHVAFLSGESIVSVSNDRTCRVWQANPKWILERTIGDKDDPKLISHRVTSLDFDLDSSRILVAGGMPSRSGELQIFDLQNDRRTFHLPDAHADVIYSAKFSPDGRQIASAGADKYVRTFDVATNQPIRRFEGHTDYVLSVDWKSNGESIASASADRTIKIWDTQTGDQRRTINQQLTKHVTAVRFVGDSDTVVSCGGDKRVRTHRSTNGGILRNFNPVGAWLHCLAVTPDGEIAAAGDASGTVTIYRTSNGQVIQTLAAPEQSSQ